MPETDERRHELQDRIEALASEFHDVLCDGLEMPVTGEWVFIICHDSAIDPEEGVAYRLTKRYQSSSRTIGLLQLSLYDYAEPRRA
jgi:hypothetical protein